MMRRRTFVSMILAAALLAAAPVRADDPGSYDDAGDPTAPEMAIDILLLRPLGLVSMAIGGVFYVAAFPFAAMTGDVRTPADVLIVDPARFTFQRPLGHIYGPGESGDIHD